MFANKAVHPTFARTVPPVTHQARAAATLFKHFGWNRVGVISTLDAYASSSHKAFYQQAISIGLDVKLSLTTEFHAAASEFVKLVSYIKTSEVRIFWITLDNQDTRAVCSITTCVSHAVATGGTETGRHRSRLCVLWTSQCIDTSTYTDV